MKASQLIEELQDYIEYYGDHKVTIWSDYTGTNGRIVDFTGYSNEFVININQEE